MKKHNFYAGPSILTPYTIKNTADAVMNFADTGLSLLEVSHRSKEFQAVMDEAQALVKELLDVPAGYSVLFLGGGASLQFAMVPMNLLRTKAAYLDTGVWAHKAIKEAKLFGEVDVVASSEDKNYNYIPKDYSVPTDVDYFHYTTNNTIYGTEIRKDPDVKVRLVADMSSDIFSRPVDVSKYDIIYAGAQKNLAPAGATLIIVRDDALGHMDVRCLRCSIIRPMSTRVRCSILPRFFQYTVPYRPFATTKRLVESQNLNVETWPRQPDFMRQSIQAQCSRPLCPTMPTAQS